MRKVSTILSINLIALVLVFAGAFAGDMKSSERSSTTQWASNLIGTTVKNLQGDTLGNITDLTIRNEKVSFAVISHGGVMGVGDNLKLVPIKALTITDNKNATIDISKDKFATAPNFEKSSADFANRQWTEDTYKFYGIQPRWKEGRTENMMERESMQEQMEKNMGSESMQEHMEKNMGKSHDDKGKSKY